MADNEYGRVIGKGGLRGKLLEPRGDSSTQPVRVAFEDGRVAEIPASGLRAYAPGVYEIALGADDLDEISNRNERDQRGANTVIPVIVEELHVDTQPVSTGAVRVHRRTYEDEQLIDVPLRKEHLDVRHIVVNREVDGPLPVRREGDVTIVPIVEEVLVIGKKFVLKEEVHITRNVQDERHQERVTTLRQESEVEHVDADGTSTPLDVPLEDNRATASHGKPVADDSLRPGDEASQISRHMGPAESSAAPKQVGMQPSKQRERLRKLLSEP